MLKISINSTLTHNGSSSRHQKAQDKAPDEERALKVAQEARRTRTTALVVMAAAIACDGYDCNCYHQRRLRCRRRGGREELGLGLWNMKGLY